MRVAVFMQLASAWSREAVLRLSELITALSTVDGVESVSLTSPAADATIAPDEIHLWTSALTYSEI